MPAPSDIEQLRDDALAAIDAASDLAALEDARVAHTGRRSPLADVQKQLGGLEPDARRELGQAVNAFRERFEERFEARRVALEEAELAERFERERVDVTAPPRRLRPGRPHLLTQVQDEIVDAMVGLGYQVAEGPEAEAAIYAFDMLNIPLDHPARLEMDTVYVDRAGGVLLRPHTSPVQARVMTSQPPPIAVVCPGRVFRNDAPDATHSPVFMQVEGLYVDEGVTMAHLRGTLRELARALFGPGREVRLRPSFFPFTEPSAEVDVSCGFCNRAGLPPSGLLETRTQDRAGLPPSGLLETRTQDRAGLPPSGVLETGTQDHRSAASEDAAARAPDPRCRVCSGTGWIEILGAGMVDPNVIDVCGIDPQRYTGFAFGIGVERVAMLRHGVADVRDLYENDARFLEAF